MFLQYRVVKSTVLESNRPAFQFQHRHCVIWNKLLNWSIHKISFAKQGYYLPHKNYFILDNLCIAVSKDSMNGDTITPQCQFSLFNLNPPIMVNIFKWFSIIYGKYTKKALPVLMYWSLIALYSLDLLCREYPRDRFLHQLLLVSCRNPGEGQHSLGYHGAPFASKKVLDTTHKQNQSNSKLGKLNRQVSKENTQMANKYMKRCSTSFRKCKSKWQWATTSLPLEWLLKKKGNIISASKDAEKLDPSIPFLGMLTKELKAETQILVCQWSKHYLQ